MGLSKAFAGCSTLRWLNRNRLALGGIDLVAGRGIRFEWMPPRLVIHSSDTSSLRYQSFDIVSITDNAVLLRKGAVRVHGIATVYLTTAEQLTALVTSTDSEAPSWIYIQRVKESGAVTLEVTDTVNGPVSSDNLWCFPLYTMYLNSNGRAVLDHDWRTDINPILPLG